MKTKLIAVFLLGLLGFTACEKENELVEQNTDRETLAQLAEMEGSTDNFLITGERINNTHINERFVQNQQDRAVVWRPFPSGWGWDCVGCFGMCNVDNPFPFPFPGDPVPFPFPWGSIEHTSVGGVVDAGAEGKKLQVYPKPEELSCAITEDGFFPISENIPMSEEMCSIIELPMGTVIQAGVYAANMGDSGEYESVTLNLLY